MTQAERWKSVRKLYTKIPQPVIRHQRKEEKELLLIASIEKAAKLKRYRHLMRLLDNPKSTKQAKRLARIEIAALDDPTTRRAS